MSIFRKITAGVCAAAISASLCACSTNLWGSDISYGAVIDGVTVPAGVFIADQMDAYYDALYYVEPEASNPSADVVTDTAETTTAASETTAETTTTAFTDKVIEGKSVEEWINDKATTAMQEYVAIEKKFDELGLSFKDREDEKIAVYLDSMWESYGSTYENAGISEASLKAKYINAAKQSAIFDYYYAEGGEKEVSKDDITAYIYANDAKINYIEMELKDGSGNLLKSDGKAEIKAMAEDYIARAQGGEDFNAILKEYNDFYAKLQADAGVVTADETAADETAADETTETEEAAPDNTTTIYKDGTTPSAAVDAKVFGGDVKIGDVFLVEEDEVYYIVKLEDILGEGSTFYDENADSIRHTLKDDEFSETITSWTANQTVVKNEAAYKTYKVTKFAEEG